MAKVFVSSTAEDLLEYRKKVMQTLLRLRHQPIAMEFQGARPKAPAEVCLNEVKGCDALVVMVAHRYGWIVPKGEHDQADGRKSITRLEVEGAIGAGLPVFAFLVEPSHPWPSGKESDRLGPSTSEEEALEIRLAVYELDAFRKFLESGSGLTRDTFTTPDNLDAKVTAALANWQRESSPTEALLTQESGKPRRGGGSADHLPPVPETTARGLRRFFGHSKLLQPEALVLDPTNPDHLVGRDEDAKSLAELCRDHPLIFVSGESGAGKSALVRAGLLPRLREEPGLLPIYVNSWGADWSTGAARAVDRAITTALQRAGLSGDVACGSSLRERLREVSRFKGLRTPILVFDQFDDYVALHAKDMVDPQRRSILQVDQLVAQNPFWADIQALLEEQCVQLCVVTRSDRVAELDAIRFLRPFLLPVDRPRHSIVGELLKKLTAKSEHPVVADPSLGWTAICDALERDLKDDEGSTILPIRLRTALLGIRELPRLTLRAYRRAGGVEGLERRHVERAVTAAARHLGHDSREVLAELLKLIDRESGQGAKTIARRFEELPLLGADDARTEGARTLLVQRGIVRVAADPEDGRQELVLYHDYLAKIVLEVQRHAERWRMLLEERALAFEKARSWWQKWKALPTTWEQVAILWARLRKRVPFGQRWKFGCLATVRFAPLLLLGIAVWLLISAFNGPGPRERALELVKRIVEEPEGWSIDDSEGAKLLLAESAEVQEEALSVWLNAYGSSVLTEQGKRLEVLLGRSISMREACRRLAEDLLVEDDPEVNAVALSEFSRVWLGEWFAKNGDHRFCQEQWVKISGGSFQARAEEGEELIEMKVRDFEIGKYPVTVGEYSRFIAAGGYKDERYWDSGGFDKEREVPYGWEDQNEHPTRPVVGVSWYEAMAYCSWKGGGVRLPSGEEWSRAAHGTEAREYPWGNDEPSPDLANFDMRIRRPTPVGVYPRGASQEGTLDLAGNVWEWTSEELKNAFGPYRVARGGSWLHDAQRCRSAFRDAWRDPCNRLGSLGFRLCRGPEGEHK